MAPRTRLPVRKSTEVKANNELLVRRLRKHLCAGERACRQHHVIDGSISQSTQIWPWQMAEDIAAGTADVLREFWEHSRNYLSQCDPEYLASMGPEWLAPEMRNWPVSKQPVKPGSRRSRAGTLFDAFLRGVSRDEELAVDCDIYASFMPVLDSCRMCEIGTIAQADPRHTRTGTCRYPDVAPLGGRVSRLHVWQTARTSSTHTFRVPLGNGTISA